MHVTLAAHPPLLVAHSLTSKHVVPSAASVYPAPHEQVKVPAVLLQTWSQPPLLTAHSLLSLHERPFASSV
jgi:hypothetical protein